MIPKVTIFWADPSFTIDKVESDNHKISNKVMTIDKVESDNSNNSSMDLLQDQQDLLEAEAEHFFSNSNTKVDSVDIKNSSDVIVGAVTHYNVNGNLTIVNNNSKLDKLDKAIQDKRDTGDGDDKLLTVEKSSTKTRIPKCIFYQKIVSISFLMIFGLLTILMISLKANIPKKHQDGDQLPINNFKFNSISNEPNWHTIDSESYFNTSITPLHLIFLKYEGVENFQIYCKRLEPFGENTEDNFDFNCIFFIDKDGNMHIHIKKKEVYGSDIKKVNIKFEKLLLSEETFHHLVDSITTFNIINILSILLFITVSILIIIVFINFIADICLKTSSKKQICLNSNGMTKVIQNKDNTSANEESCTRIENHIVFTRKDWSGYQPRHCKRFTSPVKLIVIKHIGAGKIADTFEMCSRTLITVQSENMAKGMPDIYCNFFIGGDGNVYVGRGWDVQPEYKTNTIDIVFSGNFDIEEPPEIMVATAQALIKEGVKRKKIAKDYVVVPHNQIVSTRSPGIHLIKIIKTWSHYERLFYQDILP